MQSPDSHRYRHKYLLKCPYAFDTSAFDTGLHHYNLRQSLCSESVYHDGASPCTHQDTNDYPDVVSVKQMCIMLGGISMKTAYKLLGNGEIHHLKIGKSFKIPKICVIEYLLG